MGCCDTWPQQVLDGFALEELAVAKRAAGLQVQRRADKSQAVQNHRFEHLTGADVV